MCSAVFGDMNNLYSLGVIERYLSFFMGDMSLFLASTEFITRMSTCPALSQLSIFKVVQHAEVWTHVNFLVF
jgi:hypothetical protein